MRYESVEENVPLDLQKPPAENFELIFSAALDSSKDCSRKTFDDGTIKSSISNRGTSDSPSLDATLKAKSLPNRVAHLNNLVQLLTALRRDEDTKTASKATWGFTTLELLTALVFNNYRKINYVVHFAMPYYAQRLPIPVCLFACEREAP